MANIISQNTSQATELLLLLLIKATTEFKIQATGSLALFGLEYKPE